MTYQAANRLATVADEMVEFDADGNMVLGGVNRFDSRNRLVQAGDVVYSYDAENQRIGVNQTQFVVNSQPALSQVLVQEVDGQKTFYIYGLGLIGQETGDEYLSYHFDYRGSTIALTDSSGQIVEQYQYSPYGLLLSGDSSKTPFLFNGKYGVMTDSNNLYYMRARFYSPEIKRFINQDILLGGIGEGQTLNRYAFVTGRPVSFVDPFGLSRCTGLYGDELFSCLLEETFGWIKDLILPRPYAGVGVYADYHFLFFGQNSEESFIDGMNKTCFMLTHCGSVGIGLFAGRGITFPGGVAKCDIEDSLAGNSVSVSVDYGGCGASPAYGSGVSVGYNEEGVTSVGSSKGVARYGAGCGASITIDICTTQVQWCYPNE